MTIKLLTNDECDLLLKYAKRHEYHRNYTLYRPRNYCLLLFMLDAGLRIGEVSQLTFLDIFYGESIKHTIEIRSEISKNKQSRLIPLTDRLINAIDYYRDSCFNVVPPKPSTFFFPGPTTVCHLTTRTIHNIVKMLCSGALNRSVNPHQLRHTFATRLMQTSNIRIVQTLLGHTKLASTQIYTHPNHTDLRKAIDKL